MKTRLNMIKSSSDAASGDIQESNFSLARKLLLSMVACTCLISSAYADQQNYQQWQAIKNNPVCQPLFQQQKATHQQIKAAIAANDANTVGTLVIADHNYMQTFIASNPECAMPHHS